MQDTGAANNRMRIQLTDGTALKERWLGVYVQVMYAVFKVNGSNVARINQSR